MGQKRVLNTLLSAAIPAEAIHVCLAPEDSSLDLPPVRALHCPNAYAGMGHTIADAVSATASAAGWLICLADMPFIKASTFATLWRQAPLHKILAPAWQGQRGHPVYFDRDWRESLCQLQGDRGARPVLDQNQAHLALLSVDDPGITLDIDTPSDLNRPLIL